MSQVVQLLDAFNTMNDADMQAHADLFATRREALLSRARNIESGLGAEEWLRLAAMLATIDRMASDLRGEALADKDDDAVESL